MKKRDVLFIGLGLLLVCAAALLAAMPNLKKHVDSVNCGNQMASIGVAARIWVDDNTNCLPLDFLSMSNELCAPRILICPSDHSRQPAVDWSTFTQTNSSYEILTPGVAYNDTNAFFRCQVHGHLGYADGSIFDGKRRRIKAFW
jgi:hypothetical protein